MTSPTSTVDAEQFQRDWEQWHHRHETVRADRHGFLAITGLHFLSGPAQRFDDAPGSWRTGPAGVSVELDEGEQLVVDGEPVRGRYDFAAIPERGGINAIAGDAVIEVARRGGHHIVRPRHPEHPTRLGYGGTPAFAPDPRWAVPGRYVAFEAPRPTTVGSVVEDLTHVYEAPGHIEFAIDGLPLRLTVFNGYRPDTFSILFTDATSGVTTYPANRSLQVDAPGPDGTVILDFNRATNLPCAYTEFATCPLPPAENRLPVAIEAGEKDPHR